jgi:hypothetical protein
MQSLTFCATDFQVRIILNPHLSHESSHVLIFVHITTTLSRMSLNSLAERSRFLVQRVVSQQSLEEAVRFQAKRLRNPNIHPDQFVWDMSSQLRLNRCEATVLLQSYRFGAIAPGSMCLNSIAYKRTP